MRKPGRKSPISVVSAIARCSQGAALYIVNRPGSCFGRRDYDPGGRTFRQGIARNATQVFPFDKILQPIGIHNGIPFTTENGDLNLILPATLILIASSFTCQFGVWGIRQNDRKALVRNIGVTVVFGISFLLMQIYDYSVLFKEGLTLASGPFGTTYFTLTGFHFAHVFGGVIMLATVLYRGMAGQFSSRHHDMVEATSLYWHFVDVVWIALFSTLYIL